MTTGLSTADELADIIGMADNQTRSTLIVTFSIEAQENEQKSREKGRRIFEDVEVIEIRVPGDHDFVRRVATQQDREQYPRQYLAFKRSQTQETVNGTPLSVWPQMLKSQVEEARAMGIQTVEQLAAVSDVHVQRFGPGWIELRQHARDWEKAATDGAATVKLRSDLEAMTARVKTLEAMLTKQAQELHRDPTVPRPVVASDTDEKIAKLEAMVARLAQGAPLPVEGNPLPVQTTKIDGRSKAARAAKAAAAKNAEG